MITVLPNLQTERDLRHLPVEDQVDQGKVVEPEKAITEAVSEDLQEEVKTLVSKKRNQPRKKFKTKSNKLLQDCKVVVDLVEKIKIEETSALTERRRLAKHLRKAKYYG